MYNSFNANDAVSIGEKRLTSFREKEIRDVIIMQKRLLFLSNVFVAVEICREHINYPAIMLIGNCSWPRPVKRFGTLSLRSHNRSFPIVAFPSTDVSVSPIAHRRACLHSHRDSSTLLNSSVFRLHSQRRQLTIVRDLKSASFTVTVRSGTR